MMHLRIIATVRAEVPAEWPAVRHSYGASGVLPLARLIRSAVRDHQKKAWRSCQSRLP